MSPRVCLIVAMLCLGASARARADSTARIESAGSAPAGALYEVRWTGPNAPFDTIVVAPAGAPDAAVSHYIYAIAGSPARVLMPFEAGDYELRYVANTPRAVLARAPLKVVPVTATVTGPDTAAGGTVISVTWAGPNNQFDKLVIVPVGTPEGVVADAVYTNAGNPARMYAPKTAGEYEIRYIAGFYHATLAAAKLVVPSPSVSLDAPSTVVVGSSFDVKWHGPGQQYDLIVLAQKDAPDESWMSSAYVTQGKPLALRAPLSVGEYEVRYLTGVTHSVSARAPLTTTPANQESGALAVSASQPPLGRARGAERVESARPSQAPATRIVDLADSLGEVVVSSDRQQVERARKTSAQTRVAPESAVNELAPAREAAGAKPSRALHARPVSAGRL